MTSTESAELGPLLHRLVPAVKAVTGVERVYYLALMERAAHFHLWLVPKRNEGELLGVAYLAQQPPLTATLSGQNRCRRRSELSWSRLEDGHGARYPRTPVRIRDPHRVTANCHFILPALAKVDQGGGVLRQGPRRADNALTSRTGGIRETDGRNERSSIATTSGLIAHSINHDGRRHRSDVKPTIEADPSESRTGSSGRAVSPAS